jgi:hypothetical protein
MIMTDHLIQFHAGLIRDTTPRLPPCALPIPPELPSPPQGASSARAFASAAQYISQDSGPRAATRASTRDLMAKFIGRRSTLGARMRARQTGHAGRRSCACSATMHGVHSVCPQGASRGRSSSPRQTGQSRAAVGVGAAADTCGSPSVEDGGVGAGHAQCDRVGGRCGRWHRPSATPAANETAADTRTDGGIGARGRLCMGFSDDGISAGVESSCEYMQMREMALRASATNDVT